MTERLSLHQALGQTPSHLTPILQMLKNRGIEVFSHTQGHTWLLGGRTGMNTQLGNKEPSPPLPPPPAAGMLGAEGGPGGRGSQRRSEHEQERHRRLSTQPRPVWHQLLLLLCLSMRLWG